MTTADRLCVLESKPRASFSLGTSFSYTFPNHGLQLIPRIGAIL